MLNLARILFSTGGFVLSTLLLANPASALTFTGSGTGTWGTPLSNENNPQITGVGTPNFTWGTASLMEANPNQLSFQGNQFTAEVNDTFKVGDLTYFNGTILADTGIASVPLNFELTLSDPIVLSQVFSLDFEILTTPNVGTVEENADAVIPIASMSEQSFSLNGKDYTLSLVGFSQDGGLTTTEEFHVLEDAETTASLFGRIVAVPPEPSSRIPEPGAIAGLCSLALLLGWGRGKNVI
jgi:hypothetical protein